MTTALSILKKARRLLTKREKWTKGHLARTRTNTYVYFRDPLAFCFCSAGAIYRACNCISSVGPAGDAVAALAKVVSPRGTLVPWKRVIRWNDRKTTTHRQVLAAFDRAIALAEADK